MMSFVILSVIGIIFGIAMVYIGASGKVKLPDRNSWYSRYMLTEGQEHWLVLIGITWISFFVFFLVELAKK